MHRSGKMRSSIRGLVWGSLGLSVALLANIGLAQQTDPEQIFGQAVHHYFDGQYEQSVQELTTALDSGVKDPRFYYYRGLSKLHMGDEDAAKADFQTGAEIEAFFAGQRNFNIPRSLMRVQGATRMMIETARAEARVSKSNKLAAAMPLNRRAALAALGQLDVATSEGSENATGQPAMRPNLPDLSDVDDPTAPFSDAPAVDIPADTDDAFEPAANDAPVDDPFAEPAGNEPAGDSPVDDPFAEPAPAKTDTPAGNVDPFAEPPAQPAAKPAGTDPFAEPADEPATTDPFAEPAAEPATAGNTPKPSSANVRGGRVLKGLFGALSSPVKKAVESGARAMQQVPGAGLGPGPGAPGGFPGGDDDFPGGDDFPAGDDPFGGQ